MDISWDIYRTFLAVLTEGSLSGAARVLGLTQPTAGRHIDALQAAIGYPLFTRSKHGLTPTQAALDLKPYAQAMAATSAAFTRAASVQGNAVAGSVRISASQVIGVEVLPPILTKLHRSYPDLTIELSLSNSAADLLRRDADIAVRMFAPRQEALMAQRIGDIHLGLHAHKDYLARVGIPESLADAHRFATVGFDSETPAIRSLRKLVPEFDDIRFQFKSDDDLAQLAAIRAGFGIGFCQTGLAARDPDLRRVLPDIVLPLPTYVVMHEDLKSTRRYLATFDALVAGLRDYLASSD